MKENKRRHINLNRPYNQHTGEGCNGERVLLEIKDAPFPLMWLPKEMFDEPIIKKLQKHKSIAGLIAKSKEPTKELWVQFWFAFCQLRFKYDFEFYAVTSVVIQDKLSAKDIFFTLNRGQRRLLGRLEKMRLAGIPIRIILLKARQWGGSTLIQIYMNWIQTIHIQKLVVCYLRSHQR